MEQPLNSTPAVLQIPIAKIRPNANNPRRVIKPGKVEILAASMKAVGQETPIKVRKLGMRSEELGVNGKSEQPFDGAQGKPEIQIPSVPSGQAMPTEPADSTGSPQVGAPPPNDSYEYELIGGHIRLEAAKSLGWETLSALLLEVSGVEAELAAILDNQGEDMHWLDWYQAIERRYSATPKPTQQRIADELEVSQAQVNNALKVTGLLSPAARQAIYHDVIIGGDDGPSEMAVRRLTDLEDPQKVESALKVVIDQKLTEPQTRDLVDWVKAGNDPATFNFTLGKMPDGSKVPGPEVLKGLQSFKDNPKDPNASYWQPLPPNVNIRKSSKGYRVTMVLSLAEGPVAVYGAMANLEHVKSLAGETEDTQYKDALQKICADGAAEWITEKRKLGVRSEELGVNGKSEQPQDDSQGEQPGEKEIVSTGVASSSTPAYSAGTSGNDSQGEASPTPGPVGQPQGLLGQLHGAVKGYLKDLPGSLSDSLLKDGKQAVNYEIRKGMRNVIKDIFKGN